MSKSDVVYVQQNVNATDTTGGIVWESAYLLLDYLLKSTHQRCSVTADDTTSERYTVIDLGAGKPCAVCKGNRSVYPVCMYWFV